MGPPPARSPPAGTGAPHVSQPLSDWPGGHCAPSPPRRGGSGEGLPAQPECHVVGEAAPLRCLPGASAEVGQAGGGGAMGVINPGSETRLRGSPRHPSPTQCPLPPR